MAADNFPTATIILKVKLLIFSSVECIDLYFLFKDLPLIWYFQNLQLLSGLKLLLSLHLHHVSEILTIGLQPQYTVFTHI
jgi:hypothetical protein